MIDIAPVPNFDHQDQQPVVDKLRDDPEIPYAKAPITCPVADERFPKLPGIVRFGDAIIHVVHDALALLRV